MWLGLGQSLLDTHQSSRKDRPAQKLTVTWWPPIGHLCRPGRAERIQLGEGRSHERPMRGTVRSRSQWWAHISRRACSRRTSHIARHCDRSNSLIDPQAVPLLFILNLIHLLFKTWRCMPTATLHVDTSCPVLGVFERDGPLEEKRLHCALQFSPGSWCETECANLLTGDE